MKRSSYVLLSLALVAALAAGWFLFWPRLSLPADPLLVVPADAIGVLRVRVDRVLASDAYKRFVLQRDQARGIERVKAACGFNPLERVRELVVFARAAPSGGLPRFTFAARGALRHEELLDCVKKFTGTSEAGLRVDEIEGIPTLESKKGTSRAAFIGRDAVIGGDADGVRAAIHTLLEKAPSIAQDPLLSGLFRDIDQHSDLALAARLPDDAKLALLALGRTLGADLRPIEGVQALSANASEQGERLQGGARLVTRDAQQAAALVALAKGAVARLLAIPGIGLTPMSGVLRGVQMEARGEQATFAGSVRVSTVEALLELLPAFQQLMTAPAQPSPATPATGGGALSDGGVPAADAGETKEERRRRRRAEREAASKATPDKGADKARNDDPDEE